MAARFYFTRNRPEDLISVTGRMIYGEERVTSPVVIDTGATHTIFDLNLLLMHGFHPTRKTPVVSVGTAGGVIQAYLTELSTLTCIGLERNCFPIMAYDFLLKGTVEPYGGMIGLDFLENHKISIDLKHQYIQMILSEDTDMKEST